MNTIRLGSSPILASCIAYGCMKIGGSWDRSPITEDTRREALAALNAALEQGINFFDHADIYSRGKSEQVFAQLWKQHPGLRQDLYIQTKCGIRFAGDPTDGDPGRYDFSYDHIVSSVEGSLRRLGTDSIDVLLLHRPDALVEPEEVARAFDHLYQSGKVSYFGVSNHTAAQITLLREYLDRPLVANQMELSILHTHLIEEGVTTNQDEPAHPVRGSGTLEYCRQNGITLQAWGPLAYGKLSGRQGENRSEREIKAAALVSEIARQKNTAPEAVVIAWILRHPAGIQPVIGTTNPERIQAACQADQIELSREEWYSLWVAGRGAPLP